MVDVAFCVVGARFAGLTSALRLKQADGAVRSGERAAAEVMKHEGMAVH